jgi:hypothetical protein
MMFVNSLARQLTKLMPRKLNNDNVSDDEPVYEELDRIITDEEILVAISNLKRSKSHGIDGLLNES